MQKKVLYKIFGLTLLTVGVLGICSLLFFYSTVLFSDTYPTLAQINELFRMIFTIPTGLLVLYALFVIIFIPLFLCSLFGIQLLIQKRMITRMQFFILSALWILALLCGSVTVVHRVQEVMSRLSPFSQNPVVFGVVDAIPLSVSYAFKTTLKNEINSTVGVPVEGYEPYMFMEAFPGLTETDFEGVEASIGQYTIEGGKLIHKIDETKLIHSAAKAVTDRGLDTLLANVSVRLKVDLAQDGTLTEIMEALIRYSETAEAPALPPIPGKEAKPNDMVACTADAKICPDGSAVGRIGPNCTFAPCPSIPSRSVHVCTEAEKQSSICTKEYAPVCGLVAIQCVTTPCDPIPQTFGNGCSACGQGNVISYTQGECAR